jgi:hypothetical protein
MLDEKILMQDGEGLARTAVESGMGSKQLQDLYRLAKRMAERQLPYVEAYIKRQMDRSINGSVKGFMAFAKAFELLKKYEGNPVSFVRVLMYAAMLYGYCEKEPVMKYRMVAEPVIRRIIEAKNMSLEDVSLKLYGRNLNINVKVQNLSTSPKVLSDEIVNNLKNMKDFSNLNLKVWIESK